MKIEKIGDTRKYNKDIREKRATYGVYYPNEHVFFSSESELQKIAILDHKDSIKPKIAEKKLTFNFLAKTIENYYFLKCSFYYKQELKLVKIKRLTFRDCVFKSCFIGAIIFEKVIFQNSIFELCDFSNTEFRNCIFEKCEFVNCSAENVIFTKTEIEPNSFLKGICFPKYNLDNCTKEFIKELKQRWHSIRYRIASSIYQSNSEVYHSRFSDISLYNLKKEELLYLCDLLKSSDKLNKSDKKRFNQNSIVSRIAFNSLNNLITKGGISISRLVIVAIILILIFNFFIGFLSINYGINSMIYDSTIPVIIKYFENIPKTISLFFSFGYSSFNANTILGSIYLVIVSVFGLIWFAFLIPTLLRRIYK